METSKIHKELEFNSKNKETSRQLISTINNKGGSCETFEKVNIWFDDLMSWSENHQNLLEENFKVENHSWLNNSPVGSYCFERVGVCSLVRTVAWNRLKLNLSMWNLLKRKSDTEMLPVAHFIYYIKRLFFSWASETTGGVRIEGVIITCIWFADCEVLLTENERLLWKEL